MADRIDEYLEGTLGRDELTPDQYVDADAAVRAIGDARAFLASRPTPDVTASVMRRIEQIACAPAKPRATRFARMASSLWTPRQVSIRPAYPLLAAAAAILLLWLSPYAGRITPAERQATNDGNVRMFVQFRLDAAAARVQLAGSFTNWEPRYELHEAAPGIWTVTVPLSEGVHDYAFVVDGRRWMPDPYSPHISDGFGGTNSRMTLLSPRAPRL